MATVLLFFQDYTHQAKASTPTTSCGSFPVASTSTWLGIPHRRPDCNNPSAIAPTPFQRSGFSSTPVRRDGDEGAVAMLLVQEAEQAHCDGMRLMLQPLGKMHRYPLRSWTEVTVCRIDKIELKEEMEEGRLERSRVFTAQKSGSAPRTPRPTRAFTPQKNADTQEEEQGKIQQLWSPSTGATMANLCAGGIHYVHNSFCDGERRNIAVDGVSSSTRDIRPAHTGRGAECHRESEASTRATASSGENGATDLRQAGEKAQSAATGANSQSKPASFLESIYRGIGQKMEDVCQRVHRQRCRSGTESGNSQGGSDRCKAEIRHSQGGQRSTRCCPSRRGRRYFGWNGRRPTRPNGDCGGNPGQHHGDGDQFGCTQNASDSGAERAGQQEAKDRQRRRRRNCWTAYLWAGSAPAFWWAQQIDHKLEVCLGHHAGLFHQEEYATHQWTHSILTEPDFVSEWRASINALDLAFNMNENLAHQPDQHKPTRDLRRSATKDLRVRFHHIAELFVGAEQEQFCHKWKIPCNTMVKNTRLFRPLRQALYDESSFMSMGNHERTRTFGPTFPDDDRILEHDDIAIDPNDIPLEAPESDQSSDDEGTVDTDRQHPEQHDWFATLIYALDHQPVPLRVDWNDAESMHRDAARALDISHHDLLYLHHVRHAPQDLADAGVEALIGHRHGDIAQGSPLQLVLLDVEFHAANPMTQPEVVRRAVRLPRHIGRLTLLNCLGLAEYCRTMQQSCILWYNGAFVSPYSARPMEISHGVYIRIAVPPGDSSVEHIGTRCVATACHQGVSLSELCDRHALYALGWYDTIIDHPIVPLRPDEEETALMQLPMPSLPTRPWFLNTTTECLIDARQPVDRAEDDVGDITRDYINTLDQEPPGGIMPRPGLDEQPEHIQRIMEQLEENGATETEEEGPVLYVNTWFLNHPTHRSCPHYRTVRITGEFGTWHQQFLRTWRDLLEEGQPVDFHVVEPQPPTTRMQPACLPHLILLQRTPEDERAAVITLVDSRDPAASFQHTAHFIPRITVKEHVIVAIDRVEACYPQISDLQCMIWHGERQLPEGLHIMTHHGISLLVIIQDVTYMSTQAWDQEEEEPLTLMQTSQTGRTDSRGLNPRAPIFRPGCPIIQQQSEFIQDLFVQWNDKTQHCRDERKSTEFAVWFVDHERQRFQCLHPRRVRLHDDFENWETTIKQVWREHVVHHEEHELTLVQPNPPEMEHDLAGHIIFVQNPHDSLVTNLWTLYLHDTTSTSRGPNAEIAGTTHEHVRMEHIIAGLGYQMQCLQSPPTHHCEVWYGTHQLHRGSRWMGRSGMGILIHVTPMRPLGPILLQLSATISLTQERQTHGQVAHTHGPCDTEAKHPTTITGSQAHTHAVEIIDGGGQGNMPTFLEIEGEVTPDNVQNELARWGHQVTAFDCHPHNKYFCIPKAEEHESEALTTQHFLFCHQDVNDVQGCFAHSAPMMLTENQLMQFLCHIDYARAVIVKQERLTNEWTKVTFSHQEPAQDLDHRPHRARTPWPQALAHHFLAPHPMIDLDAHKNQSIECSLIPGFKKQDLQDLFDSATDVLCRDFQIEGLPEDIAAALHPPPQQQLDLDLYDRILIYTDGSSRPEGRKLPPERADELGLADTWAFLVLGEQYATETSEGAVHALGWMAHPVRYNPEGQAYTGIQRVGSDQAERSAVTFAGLWRLARNTNVPTIICTDSSTTGGQAFGKLGAADPDLSFRVMRGVYQALQCALPPGHLLWHHTKSHAGDPFNEFVDFVAKAESRKSFHHCRQRLDMGHWNFHLQHIWMIFGEKYGVPRWQEEGFAVPPPNLPEPAAEHKHGPWAKNGKVRQLEIDCGFCIATANVQSLSKGPQGHKIALHPGADEAISHQLHGHPGSQN